MEKDAFISDCKRYRYSLERTRNPLKKKCVWIMLNPSTADHIIDDPTIKKVIGFSDKFGFGGCIVINLFSFRATNPKELQRVEDPIGPSTDSYYHNLAEYETIICAWGNNGRWKNRSTEVKQILLQREKSKLYCLEINKATGEPKHPLYVSYQTLLKEYE